MFEGIKADQPLAPPKDHGVGGDHLGIKARPPGQDAMEEPAMPVGPIHHRGDREAKGGVEVHSADFPRETRAFPQAPLARKARLASALASRSATEASFVRRRALNGSFR